MILSQKTTKWFLFGAFFLFMPSLYYAIQVIFPIDPIHMVSLMFMGKPFFFLSTLNLAVYLPLYYFLAAFLSRKLFSISEIRTRQTITVLLLVGISTLGLFYGYGWSSFSEKEKITSSFPWLQTLLLNEGWISTGASPRRIIAPGQVSIAVYTNTFPKGNAFFAWDLDEDGEAEIQKPKLYRTEVTYQQPGLYHPRVVVTDPEGWTYKAKIEVPVLDRSKFEARLNMQWRALGPILANRDEEALKRSTAYHFRNTTILTIRKRLKLRKNLSSRYTTPLRITETYEPSGYQTDRKRWVVILQGKVGTLAAASTQTRLEVGFEYDYDNPDYKNQPRISFYKELPDDYTLESHLSSQLLDMGAALAQGNIEEALKFIGKHRKKAYRKYWSSEDINLVKEVRRLNTPLVIVKDQNGMVTLQSAVPQGEQLPSNKLTVKFIREPDGEYRISNYEVLLNNEELSSELNILWMSMWDALAQGNIDKALQYTNNTSFMPGYFYKIPKAKQYLRAKEWMEQKVDWAQQAKQFKIPLKLVNRCSQHILFFVYVFPHQLGKQELTYLEVHFKKIDTRPWIISELSLYSRPLHGTFMRRYKDDSKGKEFKFCF